MNVDFNDLFSQPLAQMLCALLATAAKLSPQQADTRHLLETLIRDNEMLSDAEYEVAVKRMNNPAAKSILFAAQYGAQAAHRLRLGDYAGFMSAFAQGNFRAGEANREFDILSERAKTNALKKNRGNHRIEAEARQYYRDNIEPLGLMRDAAAELLTKFSPIEKSTALTYLKRWAKQDQDEKQRAKAWAEAEKQHPDLFRKQNLK